MIFLICVAAILFVAEAQNGHIHHATIKDAVDAAFRRLDTNNNTFIEESELNAAFAHIDDDGRIQGFELVHGDGREFESFLPKETPCDKCSVQQDGDGKISRAEYKTHSTSGQYADAIFGYLDTNHDDFLEKSDVHAEFVAMDHNHNNELELHEFDHYYIQLIEAAVNHHGHGPHAVG